MTDQTPATEKLIEVEVDELEAPKETLPEGFLSPKEFALEVANASGTKFAGKNLRRLLRSGEVEGAQKFSGRWGIPSSEVAKVVEYLAGKAAAKAAAAAAKEAGDEEDADDETLS